MGQHGEEYHEEQVQNIEVEALQADERYGFAGSKQQGAWGAELMDPKSKFVISHVQGQRNEELIRRLFTDGARRLANRHDIALFTDGLASYATLFPEIFGIAYQPARQGTRGRFPQTRYRIPRTAAHAQIIKHRQSRRLVDVEIHYIHGNRNRINQALQALGHSTPNTSIIERRNGPARLMNISQVRKSLAFSRRADTKVSLGWWTLTVYNWCRSHRSLKRPLLQPMGKKSFNNAALRWFSV